MVESSSHNLIRKHLFKFGFSVTGINHMITLPLPERITNENEVVK